MAEGAKNASYSNAKGDALVGFVGMAKIHLAKKRNVL